MIQHTRKHIKPVLLLLVTLPMVACHHYYMAIKSTGGTSSQKASVVDSLNNNSKFFILRSGNEAYYMRGVSLNDDKSAMLCILDSVPGHHRMYLTKARKGRMIYKKHVQEDLAVLQEAHVYISPGMVLPMGNYVLPLNKIQKIEIIKKDKGKTAGSYVVGGLEIGAGVAIITAIIASGHHSTPPPPPPSSTTSGDLGCSPQVYTMNNGAPALNGTLCSGAIYASLKRTDYLPVTETGAGKLNLILKGEENEELMLKNFQLIQVTHSAKQTVLIDKKGNVITYENPVAPEHAFTGNGNDVANDINAADDKYYSFTNEAGSDNSSDVVLDFKKPIGASTARLIVRGKNSPWAYYVFGEFKKLYGKYYHSMIEKKDKADPAKVFQCMVDQSLPLLVSVKDGTNWKFVDYFFTPGNVALRDMIMQLNLDDFKNKDRVQIRLQTAYMFWDLDYAAMDFSNNRPASVSYITPSQFYTSGDVSQQFQFSGNDTSYLHIRGNEQLNMAFDVNPMAGGEAKTSYFLTASGYYHDQTIYKAKPQIAELRKCSGKGAFDKFSRRKFEEALTAYNRAQNDSKLLK